MAITKFHVKTLTSGQTASVDFGTTVIDASVAVQGYTVKYPNSDNHVREISVKTGISSTTGSVVTINAAATLRDDSNNSNNAGDTTIDVLVIATCES